MTSSVDRKDPVAGTGKIRSWWRRRSRGRPSPPEPSTSTGGSGKAPPSGRPPIDPRIRARRIEVARGTGRRRLRRLVGAGAVVALAAVAWAVVSSPLLDVEVVDVVGAERTGVDTVRSATGIERGDPLAWVDLGRAERGVEDLAWVDEAEVRRAWPGTVRVSVEERTAVAVVPGAGAPAPAEGADGGWMLLGADGRQLERTSRLPDQADLVVIEGVEPDEEPGSVLFGAVGALRAAAAVPEALRPWIARFAVGDNGDLEVLVVLEGGEELVAQLGPPVDLPEKMVALATIVDQADLEGVTSVNIRVPTSPALTREPLAE